MDASFIAPTPPAPISAGADAAPDAQGEDADAFASHLPAQDAPAKPAPRKPPAKQTQPDAYGAPEPASYTLSAPTAPVAVRIDATPGLLDVAFTPAPIVLTPETDIASAAAGAPVIAAATAAPFLPAAAAPQTAVPPAGVADAKPAATTATPAAGDSIVPASTPPSDPSPAPAPAAPGAELTAALAAPAKPAAPAEPLRANGRQRGGDRAEVAAVDAPKSSASAQPAAAIVQAAARAGAHRDAPSSANASTPATIEAAPQAGALAEAAPGEHRRIAESGHVPVHRPPTPAATVAQHIVRRFDGQATTIEVRLDPAELGAVHVKLDVGADARVTAVVAADNPATLADLMRSARDLERALESAGLELASGGLSFDLSDRQSAGDPNADSEGASATLASASKEAEAAPPASRPFGLEAWRGVRVDMTV